MVTQGKLFSAGVALLTLSSPTWGGELSATCSPTSGKTMVRLQCLSTIVASLKADIHSLKQSSLRQVGSPSSTENLHSLEHRLYVLEQSQAQKIHLGLAMPVTAGSHFERTIDSRNAGSLTPSKGLTRHASVIYSGTPLLTLSNPSTLNGVVGVKGKVDTQSGEAQRPQD
jgi:hypothetical protein